MQRTNNFYLQEYGERSILPNPRASFSRFSFPARQITNCNNVSLNIKHCINLHHIGIVQNIKEYTHKKKSQNLFLQI